MDFTVQELTETFFFFLNTHKSESPWAGGLSCAAQHADSRMSEEVPRARKSWILVSDGKAQELLRYHFRRPQRLWDHLPHLARLQKPVFCLLGKLYYTHSCKPGYHSPSECFQVLATSQWAVSTLVSIGELEKILICVCWKKEKESLSDLLQWNP